MTRVILYTVEGIIMILWAVIGLVFWFPFLVRMISLFIFSVLVSLGKELDLGVAQIGLERAIKFYPEGFAKIHASISTIGSGNTNPSASWEPLNDFWQPLAIHVISVALFWGSTCFLMYAAFLA